MSDTKASSTKQYHQYFSTRPTINITMPSSKKIRFVGGVYMTDKEDEIAFLDNEVKLGHTMIFVKQGQETVNADALDPLAAIKKKAVEEYLEQQQRAADPNRDMGNTAAVDNTQIQTSKSIASITVGSKSPK